MLLRYPIVVACVLALPACSPDKPDDSALVERDPAVVGALSDPLMVDPDLASQNRGGAALGGGGPAAGELPPDRRGPEAAAAARAEVAELLGGPIALAPMADRQEPQSAAAIAPTAVALAQALPFTVRCADRLGYSAVWAARMPAALPVYPRAHVTEAAGADLATCRVRVVRFVTPVAVNDVIDFYYAMAGKAGLAAQRATAGEDQVLRGQGAGGAFALFVRQRADGLTEAQLVTSGMPG